MDALIVVTCIVALLALLPLAWQNLKRILPVVLRVVFWAALVALVAVVIALVIALVVDVDVWQRPHAGDLNLGLVFLLLAVAVGIVAIVHVILRSKHPQGEGPALVKAAARPPDQVTYKGEALGSVQILMQAVAAFIAFVSLVAFITFISNVGMGLTAVFESDAPWVHILFWAGIVLATGIVMVVGRKRKDRLIQAKSRARSSQPIQARSGSIDTGLIVRRDSDYN